MKKYSEVSGQNVLIMLARFSLLALILYLFLPTSSAAGAFERTDERDSEVLQRRTALDLYGGWRLDDQYTDSDTAGAASPNLIRKFAGDAGYATKCLASDLYYVYSSPTRLNGRSLLWVGGILAVGGVIYIYDQEISDAFRRSSGHGPIHALSELGETFYDLGHGGVTTRYYLGAMALGYITGYRPLLAISTDLVESYIIAGSLKNVANLFAGRSRPFQGEGPRMFRFNEGTSFPSGHASNVVQLARILQRHIDFLPLTLAAYTVAGSVCVQRITSDSHWPSDVYTAIIYGYVVADVVIKRNSQRRLKVVPTVTADDSMVGAVLVYRF